MKTILVGATPFSGKTAFFNKLANQGYTLKRAYDHSRSYSGIYVNKEIMFIDLDVDAFHIFELLDRKDLETLVGDFIGKKINDYEDSEANVLHSEIIKYVIVIGHVGSRNHINIINKSDPDDLKRINIQVFKDKDFERRLEIRDDHAGLMDTLFNVGMYDLYLESDSVYIPGVPEWVSDEMRGTLLSVENDIYIYSRI